MGHLSAVEEIGPDHDLTAFDCGKPPLNDWLRRHALDNHVRGFTRTFVVHREMVVVGYYGLSMKDIVRADAPSSIRRGGPLSISVVLLGRLAVDRREQGRGLGKALLKDALLRSARAARSVGARALVVDAKDEDARRFYEHYGFRRSPTAEMQLFRRLDGIVP